MMKRRRRRMTTKLSWMMKRMPQMFLRTMMRTTKMLVIRRSLLVPRRTARSRQRQRTSLFLSSTMMTMTSRLQAYQPCTEQSSSQKTGYWSRVTITVNDPESVDSVEFKTALPSYSHSQQRPQHGSS
jgi:hypothetical protein